jgi:hypothetical protein
MKEDGMGGPCSTHGELEMHTKFLLKNLKGRGYWEDLGVDGNIILEWILEKLGVSVWTRFSWLRIGTSCWLL